MKKNLTLVITLTIALSATAPAYSLPRDGGREVGPIQRVIRIIKKLFTTAPHELIGLPPA